jgi:molybdenum cofactor cytidylyltransferase
MPPQAFIEQFSFGVVLLAAGASTRMGRPKLLLPWGSTSVIGHLVGQWQDLRAAQIGIVSAVDGHAITDELDRIGFPASNRIVNPNPERGMFGSIQCATAWMGWNPSLTHWAIALGDQPHLQKDTLRALLDFTAATPNRICQPARAGRARHPVLIPRCAWNDLRNSRATNLKQFLQAQSIQIAHCELADPGLDLDIDWPADYERARQIYFIESPP